MKDLHPNIIVFLCSWCPYACADNAGVGRMEYPANVKLIKVNCSGRVKPAFILKAFQYGADGILVTGCETGECHFINGNENCRLVIDETKEILELLGIGKDRVDLELFSGMDGKRFVSAIINFTDRIEKMGKIQLGERY